MTQATQATANMIVAHWEPQSPAAEAFRALRTNLQFMSLDNPLRSILVTSATPGEGKSTTTANLAVTFAQAGSRVCLVDGDLRRPLVAKLFDVPNWDGLTTALINQAPVEQSIRATGIPGLSVLTSGPIPPNPAELLGSGRMKALLAELESKFDLVLIDTPPLLAVTDASVLATRTDGVLLVVRSGQVPYQQVLRARNALAAVKAPLLGTVLDGVTGTGDEGYYYDYYRSDD